MPQVRRFGRLNARGLAALYAHGVRRYLIQWVETLAGPVASALLFLAVFVLARGMGGLWPGVEAASFIAAGLVILSVSHTAFETIAANLVYDKLEGIVKDLLVSPLTPTEILLGWLASAVTNGLITGIAVALALLPFADWSLALPLDLLVFALLGALLFALFGLFVGLWARKWDNYSFAHSFFVMPLVLLSGTFYLKRDLPDWAARLLDLNPAFYLIDGFRSGLLGRSDSDTAVGLAYLTALCLLLGALAWRVLAGGWRLKD